MASGVSILAGVNSKIQAGGAALSLITATRALIGTGNAANLPDGISGFLFDIPTSEQLDLQAQITDHYVEENYAVQDHIALTPMKITLTGEVGNLVFAQNVFSKFTQTVLDRLTPIGVLSPAQSLSAQQALGEIDRLQSAAQSALTQFNNLSDAFGPDETGTDPQQKAYYKLQGMYDDRNIVSVQTPWKTFPSMAIESLSFSQDEETKDKSVITAVFKEIRTVELTVSTGQLQGRILAQKSTVTNKGPVKGEDKSIAASALDTARGIGQ